MSNEVRYKSGRKKANGSKPEGLLFKKYTRLPIVSAPSGRPLRGYDEEKEGPLIFEGPKGGPVEGVQKW